MRKYAETFIISINMALSIFLCGCVNPKPADSISQTKSAATDTFSEIQSVSEPKSASDIALNPETETSETKSCIITQAGPYGQISITLPEGWKYELCPVDSENLLTGLYGIQFYPEDVTDGYIEVNYSDCFGVCGTGLSEESTELAGDKASIGTYDNNPYWDFIAFQENNKGIVALTYSVDEWWSSYSSQVFDILDTLSFDTDIQEGGIYVYNNESEIESIGLNFSLKNVSPAGATLVFNQYDSTAPTGELGYGDDFKVEIEKNGIWEEAPIALEGKYAFNQPLYLIPYNGISEKALNWEWLYGALTPGNYRIKKSVLYSQGNGDFDEYTITAYFILR